MQHHWDAAHNASSQKWNCESVRQSLAGNIRAIVLLCTCITLVDNTCTTLFLYVHFGHMLQEREHMMHMPLVQRHTPRESLSQHQILCAIT